MHKCIMVKLGGKRKTCKVCKKQVRFPKSGGKLQKVGGDNKFSKIGWKCSVLAKTEGKFEIQSNRLKKVMRNFPQNQRNSEKRGKSEIRESGKCIIGSGGWTPLPLFLRISMVVSPNLEALAKQLSRNGLEKIWSPYLIQPSI